jgi:hypothetical protein
MAKADADARGSCVQTIWGALGTGGQGPLGEDDYDELIGRLGVADIRNLADPEADAVVVGRFGWSENTLRSMLNARAGRQLRVYSQEMALYALAYDEDPFDALSREELIILAGDHPALNYLMNMGFDWPVAAPMSASRVSVNFNLEGAPEPGILKLVGYHVGKTGLPDGRRREILRDLFERIELCHGTGVDIADHVAQWGSPHSAQRLHKIARTLRSLADLEARKTSADMSEAIADRESDLRWLKMTYYDSDPVMRFQWPETSIR